MFCRKKQYLKIQKIHHKALKVVYNSNKNYDELLRDNNEFSIHQRHLRALICEVFKSLYNLNPELCGRTLFSKYNVQYKKRSFAEIIFCKIDFLQHKFSVIQSKFTLEQLAPVC